MKNRFKFSVDKRQWVLPLGFIISGYATSIYLLCFGLDIRSRKGALRDAEIGKLKAKVE